MNSSNSLSRRRQRTRTALPNRQQTIEDKERTKHILLRTRNGPTHTKNRNIRIPIIQKQLMDRITTCRPELDVFLDLALTSTLLRRTVRIRAAFLHWVID